jgi:uncharacterized protein YbjT (DUF2867 family)
MTVLVYGATGSIGAPVVAELVRHGHPVRALVRDASRAAALPAGADPVAGDLRDPAAVAAALTGVTAALYVSPHDPDEVAMAERFAATCERLGVRLIFAGVHADGRTALHRWAMRTLFGLMVPHYRGKLRIGVRMISSTARPVVFAVTNFYQNDEIVREDILEGRYPLPAHPKGLNRVDLRDAAVIITRALTEPEFPSGGYTIAGPASVGGIEAARTWSAALGRPVAYEGDGDWQAVLARRLSGPKLEDFKRSYAFLGRHGFATSPADVAATTRLLGRPPRAYAEYARDMAFAWSVC